MSMRRRIRRMGLLFAGVGVVIVVMQAHMSDRRRHAAHANCWREIPSPGLHPEGMVKTITALRETKVENIGVSNRMTSKHQEANARG